MSWARCRPAPRPGDAVNPDCFDDAGAATLEPIGEGLTITTEMPADATAEALGEPDASGGVYLPLIARVTVAGETLLASYRLRLSTTTTSTTTRVSRASWSLMGPGRRCRSTRRTHRSSTPATT